MWRWIKRVAWTLAVVGAGLPCFGAGVMPRSLSERVVVKPGGSADLTRMESVPQTELAKIYEEHAEALGRDAAVKRNFLDQVGKGLYLTYGIKPRLAVDGQDVSGGPFTRKMSGGLSRLAKLDPKDKEIREIPVKQFPDERRMLQYFEYLLDDAFFESAFVNSVKGGQAIASDITTTFVLPKGAALENQKELDGAKWTVDFGGGSTMKASLKVDAGIPSVTLVQTITITNGKPTGLLGKNNAGLFERLRQYASFTIRYREAGGQADAVPGAQPPEGEEMAQGDGLDYSASWSYSVSQPISETFTYSVLSVKPTLTLGMEFKPELLWEHEWKRVSWWKWEWRLKRFQTKITLSPSVGASVEASASATVSHEWERNIITKGTSFTFWVSCVPVLIRLEANFKVKAQANLTGALVAGTGGSITVSTTLTTKWENGWSVTATKSVTPHYDGFQANAKIAAMMKAEAPFRVSAFVYYVAGPFGELNPWVQCDADASGGTDTNVHFKLHGGLDVNGGVAMAGWLKSVVNLGEYSHTFYTYPFNIYEGYANLN